MRNLILIPCLAVTAMAASVVLDRVAVVVGRHAIKASDIDRDLRVTAFLNRAAVHDSAEERRKSAGRLVDQTIIRDEINSGDYERATDRQAAEMLARICNDRFAGSDARMRQELSTYGLTEGQIKDQLLWQLTVLKFIDQRFRPAVMVTDEEVKTYYQQHLAELKRQYPADNSLTALQPNIVNLLQGSQVDKQFDTWLDEKRKSQQVDYRQEAFQ